MSTSVRPIYSLLQQLRTPAPTAPAAPAAPAPTAATTQDTYDIDGLKALLDQLNGPKAPTAPVPTPKPSKPPVAKKPKPKPAKPKVYTVKDLPKALDVTYGSFKDEIKNVDVVATSGTRFHLKRGEQLHQKVGDLVKSWNWFDANGRLKLNAHQIADELSKPFDNTVGGKRPNGADMVVFDEVNDRLNVAPKTFARGLALAKKRHPNRPIIVYMSHPDRLNPILLKAVEKYADRVLVESYLWESRENGHVTPSDFDVDYAPIARIAPGILKKAHPVIAISEKPGPYNFNDRRDIDFRKFLNDQAYALKHNPYTKHMKGLGAYATYEAQPGTLKFFDKLVKWYSKEGHHRKMKV